MKLQNYIETLLQKQNLTFWGYREEKLYLRALLMIKFWAGEFLQFSSTMCQFSLKCLLTESVPSHGSSIVAIIMFDFFHNRLHYDGHHIVCLFFLLLPPILALRTTSQYWLNAPGKHEKPSQQLDLVKDAWGNIYSFLINVRFCIAWTVLGS